MIKSEHIVVSATEFLVIVILVNDATSALVVDATLLQLDAHNVIVVVAAVRLNRVGNVLLRVVVLRKRPHHVMIEAFHPGHQTIDEMTVLTRKMLNIPAIFHRSTILRILNANLEIVKVCN